MESFSQDLQPFRAFRALGLSFKAWFGNFVPITVLAAILYAPAIYELGSMSSSGDTTAEDAERFMLMFWMLIGASALVAPLITYRVVQYLNGAKVSMISSVGHGVRGIIPIAIFVGVQIAIGLIPQIGQFINIFIQCIFFVCGSAAVVERLNPIAALRRSAELTAGRRGGIFGVCFLVGLVVLVAIVIVVWPVFQDGADAATFKHSLLIAVPIFCAYELLIGILQAVSYALLRLDKDGVTHSELAKVFE